jgi:hypothetical protein
VIPRFKKKLSFENGGAISILTDARHGGRRNAKDTNVVFIGHETHKVLKEQHVTKEDDECTQRHELLGIKKLYSYIPMAEVFLYYFQMK